METREKGRGSEKDSERKSETERQRKKLDVREREKEWKKRERERERGRCGSLEFHAIIYDVGCWSKKTKDRPIHVQNRLHHIIFIAGDKKLFGCTTRFPNLMFPILMLNTFSELEVSVSIWAKYVSLCFIS